MVNWQMGCCWLTVIQMLYRFIVVNLHPDPHLHYHQELWVVTERRRLWLKWVSSAGCLGSNLQLGWYMSMRAARTHKSSHYCCFPFGLNLEGRKLRGWHLKSVGFYWDFCPNLLPIHLHVSKPSIYNYHHCIGPLNRASRTSWALHTIPHRSF